MPLAGGTRLGPYEILAPLGAGGMGEVYRARDTKLDRDVAVKVLPADLADDPRALARFEAEARAVAALSHPNILSIFDFGKDDGVTYSVTELLEGGTLRALVLSGRLPLRRALDLAEQVARALAAAHERGIVHRDVKPENVFVTRDGDAKLLDFGLAHRDGVAASGDTRSPTAPILTEAGAVLGTIAYMSPEQARGLPVDHRSDQFSLGILLFEMLAGHRPFRADSSAELLAAIIRDEPEPLATAAPSVPVGVRLIVERCLAREPRGRYDSTRDLARELAAWKEQGAAPAGTPGPRRRLVTAAAVVFAALSASAGLWLWKGQGLPGDAKDAGAAARSRSPLFEPRRVVVAPFENRTGDPSLDAVGSMVCEWVTDGLANAGFCEIVPASSVLQIHRADPLRELARRTGAGLLVSGAFDLSGDEIRIQGRVTEAETGTIVRALEPATAPRRDPTAAVDAVRRQVLDVVADRLLQPGRSRLEADARPPRYEAYLQKLAGDAVVGGTEPRELDFYRKALEIDPDYTEARINLVRRCITWKRWAEASSELEPLEKGRASLTPAQTAVVDRQRAWLRGRWDEAVARSRDLVRLAPGDLLALGTLVMDAYHADRPREALEVAARPADWDGLVAPNSFLGCWHLHWMAASHHLLGEHEAELALARRARSLNPDVGIPRADEARALAALGRLEELDRLVDDSVATGLRSLGWDPGAVMAWAARELRVHGRPEAARSMAGRFVEWVERRPKPADPDDRRVFLRRADGAYLAAGRWKERLAVLLELRKARPDDQLIVCALPAATLLAGDRTGAERLDAGLRTLEASFLFGEPSFGRACTAAALGRREEAVELVREALGQGYPSPGPLSPIDAVRHETLLDPLRGYPLFEELLKPKG